MPTPTFRINSVLFLLLFLFTVSLTNSSSVPQYIDYVLVITLYLIIVLWFIRTEDTYLYYQNWVVWPIFAIVFISITHLISSPSGGQLIWTVAFAVFVFVNVTLLPKIFNVKEFFVATSFFSVLIVTIGFIPLFTGYTQFGPIDISLWSGRYRLLPLLDHPIRSIYDNPNTLGYVSTVGALTSYSLYLELRQKRFLLISVISTIGVIVTQHRAGIIILIISFILYISYMNNGKAGVGVVSLVGTLIGIIGLGMIFEVLPAPEVVESMTLNDRINRWKGAVVALRHSPIIGFGFGSVHLVPYLPEDVFGLTPHNSFVRIAMNTGLLGLVFYLSIFVFLITQYWRSIADMEDVLFYALLISTVIFQMFEGATIFGISTFSVLLSVIIGYSQYPWIEEDVTE